MEARKAHRFVSINAEEMSRKILQLSPLPPEQIENVLREITRQVIQFHKDQREKAASQPVSEKLKQ